MATETIAATKREKRRRLRAERHEEILASARNVFAKKGYEGATIADIARESGVASGTLYLYFTSKTDIFAGLFEQLFRVIGSAISIENVPPDLAGATRARIHSVFSACSEHRDLLRLVFLNQDPRTEVTRRVQRSEAERLAPLAALLRGGMQAGVVRQADDVMLARLINGVVTAALYQCFVQSDGRDVQAYVNTVTAMIIGGLSPQEDAT